ncbi:oligosaccharide flippase family protein [Labilibaculum sp. A4]|uniref:lipopolysaccharide biosynthesis protein n=1 Tax=Labilibaculum euxinus TaxID=2686357 RepID=UPI000F618348|nr:oligosaccharide flippase family protein [Labilibaculum euxinus]MDQ1770352.1 oligosaccharide flippase family protein [Labilibaculum euxinus]MWN75429.1 oligosaccharide flippase family protein [Labilibaculum euxinus]
MYTRILKGGAILLSSNIVASFLGFLVLAVVAKNISIDEFGVIGIIQSYTLTVAALLNFQTWQTIIKYYPRIKDDKDLIQSLLKFSFRLDLITAIIAFVFGIIFLEIIFRTINLPEMYKYCAQIHLLSILTKLNGTATGYLRVHDKYNLFFKSQFVAGFVKLILVLIVFWLNLGFVYIIIAFAFGEIVYDFTLNLFFYKVLKSDSLTGFLKKSTKLIKNKYKDIFEFSFYSNLISSFDTIIFQADIMIVSGFFGVSYAGCFKMIKVITGLINRMAGPVSITISPIISELIAENNLKELRSKLLKSFLFLALFFSAGYIIFIALDEFMVRIVFNEEYLKYIFYLDFAIFNLFVGLIFMGIHPAANFLGYHRQILYIIIVLSLIYLLLIFLFYESAGFEIIFIAQLVQISLVVISKLYLTNKKLNLIAFQKSRIIHF